MEEIEEYVTEDGYEAVKINNVRIIDAEECFIVISSSIKQLILFKTPLSHDRYLLTSKRRNIYDFDIKTIIQGVEYLTNVTSLIGYCVIKISPNSVYVIRSKDFKS